MPRDSNGNYSLPAGNPVVPTTIIETDWANPTMDDIAQALTQSLSRTGQGGMLVPFLNADGAINTPGISWTNETRSGWYRKAANQFVYVVNGVEIFGITNNGITLAPGKSATGLPYLPITGGTMLGPITLSGPPTQSLQAATKQYVDANSGGGIEVVNYTSDATGDAQPNVWQGWNAQANATNIIRGIDEISFYRWPSNGNNFFRYVGDQFAPVYTSVEADWVLQQLNIDAPIDGTTYGRKDAIWVRVLNLEGGSLSGQLTLPPGAIGTQAVTVDAAQVQILSLIHI